MSVLIKGMEMPDGCPFCPLSHWTRGTDEFAGCEIVPGKRYAMLNDIAFAVSLAKSRPDWCPLIEIQPHGRLIDADALVKKQPIPELGAPRWLIEQAPTIIESEEEDG